MAGQECAATAPLVNGNSPIPDDHMTASGIYGPSWVPPQARINSTGGWVASTAEYTASIPNYYIQVKVYITHCR